MNGVRSVANAFAIIGWITLVVGGLVAMGALVALGQAAGSGLPGLLSASLTLLIAILLSLGPFFLWALLKVLIEIHDQGQSHLEYVMAPEGEQHPTRAAGGPYRVRKPTASNADAPPRTSGVAPTPPHVRSDDPLPVGLPEKCPRCGTSTYGLAEECPECGMALSGQG